MSERENFDPYNAPAGGWGSARSLGTILRREGVPLSGPLVLMRQNKADGFQCVSCAWSKPADALPFEFCDNGAKATAWEITTHRATPAFFAENTVTELLEWDEFRLEQVGRLTEPMRYDPGSDTYRSVSWDVAFAEIGLELRAVTDRKKLSSTAPAERPTRRATSTGSSRGSTATITCRTARTCAMRRHP
jgi:anaerobic selenocysteine-containing dehydrogenase